MASIADPSPVLSAGAGVDLRVRPSFAAPDCAVAGFVVAAVFGALAFERAAAGATRPPCASGVPESRRPPREFFAIFVLPDPCHVNRVSRPITQRKRERQDQHTSY